MAGRALGKRLGVALALVSLLWPRRSDHSFASRHGRGQEGRFTEASWHTEQRNSEGSLSIGQHSP